MQKVQSAKVYDRQARQLSALYKQIEMIENSRNLSAAEKEARVEERRVKINQLAKLFAKKEAA
jgi:DNA-binding protein H-NS